MHADRQRRTDGHDEIDGGFFFAIILQEPCVLYIGRAQNYPLDAPFYIYSTNIRTEYFKHVV